MSRAVFTNLSMLLIVNIIQNIFILCLKFLNKLLWFATYPTINIRQQKYFYIMFSVDIYQKNLIS